MKNSIFALIFALITTIIMVAAIAASYFSPRYTLYQLTTYAEKGDVSKLDEYVDFGALRENIRHQLTDTAGSAPAIADNSEFAAWASDLLQRTVNRMVEGYVSPVGIKAILTHHNPPDQGTPSAPAEAESLYRNWGTFAVEYQRNGKPDGAVILARQGLFSWRLSGAELPDWLASPDIAPDKNKAEQVAPSAPRATATLESSAGWKYADVPDQMRGTSTRIASINALSKLDFDFPYQGGSVASIVLRDRGREKPIVFLAVKPGQFSCGSECKFAVKFDNGPIKQFVMLHTDDGDPAVLWFYDSRSFIEQLKEATNVVVEANFYNVGTRQMRFDVTGLNWGKDPSVGTTRQNREQVLSVPKVTAPQRIRVKAGVTSGLLIRKVDPAYPPLARQARISGTVVLRAVISKDGSIENLSLVSGHPMLAPAAIDAVEQWKYKPYLVNGEAVEVDTEVQVNFTLTKNE